MTRVRRFFRNARTADTQLQRIFKGAEEVDIQGLPGLWLRHPDGQSELLALTDRQRFVDSAIQMGMMARMDVTAALKKKCAETGVEYANRSRRGAVAILDLVLSEPDAAAKLRKSFGQNQHMEIIEKIASALGRLEDGADIEALRKAYGQTIEDLADTRQFAYSMWWMCVSEGPEGTWRPYFASVDEMTARATREQRDAIALKMADIARRRDPDFFPKSPSGVPGGDGSPQ